ncbi:unnamed protein product [Acanthoscelides obtectus]|uniref:Exonuclease 1 n=1 Tax=Acanthoscelides obtectus TaxID=200917 RepID=A0A9P0K307_ACAOB|nr:unnamed protein product [Acanthoscelides obtectus]CAK1628791.1 Exonuclease 1 [Acanthoscelides obtectus]
MGITGLLPFLEKATKPCHISEFRGGTVAIDGYCWLHKGASACAIQLAQGEPTQVYIHYCVKYLKLLQSYDIKPIMVFDGKNLPAKADTEAKRRESRAKAKQRARELLQLGKTDEARSYLKQSINVTPEMASMVIKECHRLSIDCIVAPYESDAQLAFFNLKGIAEVIITEDSDLVLFGCTKVMYKMDLQGCGYLVEAEKIPEAMKLTLNKYSFDKFRHMCILSGCDYLVSLHGIGLKKALKFISLTNETDPEKFLKNLPRYLNMRHLQITEEYKENFMIADATFRHQIVFDPFKKTLVPLIDPAVSGTNPKYCKNAGEITDHEKAYQVALGNLHPSNYSKLDDWSPANSNLSNNSIWSGTYKRTLSRKEQKQQIKSFFTMKKQTVAATTVVDEEIVKKEEEVQINKELSFYTQKSPKTPEKLPVKSDEDVDEDTLSPVLSQDVKKRISRFPRTENPNPNVRVISRFFCRNKTVKSETITSSQELTTDESLAELESLRLSSQPAHSNLDKEKSDLSLEEDDEPHSILCEDIDKSISDRMQPVLVSDNEQEYKICSDVEIVETMENDEKSMEQKVGMVGFNFWSSLFYF